MFVRLFLAILRRSLVFYDPTFWQLKLQLCQAVNCGSVKAALPAAGSTVHLSRVQHQQNTAVLLRSHSRVKGQETSCCVFQLMSLFFLICVWMCTCQSLHICLIICDTITWMLTPLHLWWPCANRRASLLEASGHYRTWNVLSCAISWQGTVDNLFPMRAQSHYLPLQASLFRTEESDTRKALCKQKTPSPLLILPSHLLTARPGSSGTMAVPELLSCIMLRGAEFGCTKQKYTKTQGVCDTQVVVLESQYNPPSSLSQEN